MKKIFVVMFVAALTILASATAQADWSWSGYEDGNWGGLQPYDQIGVFVKSGDQFSIPTFTGLSNSFQNFADANTSTTAYAFGPTVTGNTSYTLNFTGSDNFSVLLYQVSLGSSVVGRGIWTFTSGGGVSGSTGEYTDAQWVALGGKAPVAVPEPVSTVLFLLGGATLAVRRVYKSKKS